MSCDDINKLRQLQLQHIEPVICGAVSSTAPQDMLPDQHIVSSTLQAAAANSQWQGPSERRYH